MISFRRIDLGNMPWGTLNAFRGAHIFHTRTYLHFWADFFKIEPVVAVVLSDGQIQGYFTGLITHIFGLKILGSPFRGWDTYFMGFNIMARNVGRRKGE